MKMTPKTKKKAASLKAVIAHNVRTLAEKKFTSHRAFVNAAGISLSQFYDVMNGSKAASTDWLDKVAETVDVKPHTLLQA